ncbi:hypothetical protein B9Z35_01180 [Limnohabitans sp. Jir61]|uniref:DUF3306 domain-containing protein n=1 Tax=Limnohabitans sp. Jir61 TaxID=1826168 RepID=UPI000D34CEDC|nr:DUF3306 domain-containing protein [Limnohabitans sp. Jir61]PUE32196.1 hypothetical protein B9Z35_01180 [Limnohabitans sp. Jir61]
MASDHGSDGFLSRWSRRKVDVREGRPLDEPKPVLEAASGKPAPMAAQLAVPESAASQEATPLPSPTLVDAQQLTPESDFKGFMARGVAPEVKNAAMKKLFADPHFNVMDRMDVYIDDYGLPDPLPMAMLRQMSSAKTLNLFDDEQVASNDFNMGDKPEIEETKVMAQSVPAENNSNTEPTTHDHADLRLQPDPTVRPQGTEPKPV